MIERSAEVLFGASKRVFRPLMGSDSHVTSHGVEAFHGAPRQCLEGDALSSQEVGGRINGFRSALRSVAAVEDSSEYFQR